MQPMPADTYPSGFVVEWQLADETGQVIDLSTADSEAVLPEDAGLVTSGS